VRTVPNGMNFVHSSTVIGQFAPVSPLKRGNRQSSCSL